MRAAANKKFSGKKYQYVMLDTSNTEKKDFTKSTFDDVLFVSSPADLQGITAPNVLISSEVLLPFIPDKCNVCYEPDITHEKMELLFAAYDNAANRVPIENHNLCC